ncbi:hypothetical protein TCAL_05571 [Tigriopus californicus]|uniref:C2H2-type domain-containing protein n=1 Tax=Tigriopus californicus TaxID=6832 RepID=A0A553NF43_TIGCA|nr:hypothetical protein TCAL_05571 [Tigriopus californicus]
MASSSTASLADLGVTVSSLDPMVSSQSSSTAWIHTVSVSDNFSNVVVSDASSLSEPMLLPFSSVMLPSTPTAGILSSKSHHPLGKFSHEPLLTKMPPEDHNTGPLADIVKSPFLHFESQSSTLGGSGLDWGDSKCQTPTLTTLASPMMGKRSKVNHSVLNHPSQPLNLIEGHSEPAKTIYMISDVKTPTMEPAGLSIKLLDEMMPNGASTSHHKLMPGNLSLVMPSVTPTLVSTSNPVMSNSLFGSPHVTDSSYPCLTKMVTSSQDMNLSLPNYELVSDSLDLSLSFPGLTSPTPAKLKPQSSFSLLEPMNMRCLSETAVCQPGPSPRVIEDGSGTSLRLLSNAEPVRLMPGGREQMTASPQQIFNGSVSSISLPNPLSGNSEPVKEKKNVVQPISCFKCTECGFLGLSHKQVEDHALFEHEFDLTEDNEEWLVVAQRESIKLECPFCPNKFNAEGSRSFKVHVLDDHGVNETEADKHFRDGHQKRRTKTLEWMKAKRAEEKEERRRARRDVLEAYVDEQGQLRVRNTTKGKKNIVDDVAPTPTSSNAMNTPNVDVSANEYVDALEIGKKIAKSKKLAKLGSLPDPVPQAGGSSSSPISRRKVGRPKGSRTVGLTKLKRVNRNIELSDERMGTECGLHACANRFKCADKLEYHRKCHLNSETLLCLECQNEFSHWKPLALHLWSKHKIDMELFKCDQCEVFRSFSNAKLQAHKVCHNTERTFLCDDCGKGFKSKKNLRHHQQIHRRKNNPDENPAKFVCQICQRAFREFRLLRHHTNNVHEKLKPHLCNYCGYSAEHNRKSQSTSKELARKVKTESADSTTLTPTSVVVVVSSNDTSTTPPISRVLSMVGDISSEIDPSGGIQIHSSESLD